MSFFRNLTSLFRSNQDVYSQSDAQLFKDRSEALMEHILKDTPRPTVPRVNITEEADIRLPPYPYSLYHLYDISYRSPVLSLSQMKIKQEIFRETLRIGFDWDEKFKFKCLDCGTEMEEIVEQCDYCDSTNLVKPDPRQKLIWQRFIKRANSAGQTLFDVLQELEDDLNIADDAYMILVKDYLLGEGNQVMGKIREIMRGDPVRTRIISDLTGRRGGKLWTCPEHRTVMAGKPGKCDECGFLLYPVHYVETLTGGKDPINLYIAGEVIHSSKYRQSRLYGISPVFTLWVLSYTMLLMDHYIKNLYEKGRAKGIMAIPGHYENITKWWDSEQQKLQQDPHYIPFVAVEPTIEGKAPGKFEFVKFLDTLNEMGYNEAREIMRRQISSLYGVSPIFQADMSAGSGLNNEGLQITVTDRAVDYGQSIYHVKFFPLLLEMLNITDWIVRFRPSREMDEMADLQKRGQEIDNAQKLQSMGFDIEIKNDEFIVTSTKPVKPQPGGDFQPNFPRLPAGQPDQQPSSRTEPDNRQGMKECPPGNHAHPTHVKCHPMNQMHEEEKSLSDSSTLGKTAMVEKSGDMLAHYSCLIGKMDRAGIKCPKNVKIGKEFREWVASQESSVRKQIKDFEATCLKAGNKNNPRDPDYPYPYKKDTDKESLDDCVSRKIPIIADEHPEMDQDQIVAIAFSECREKQGIPERKKDDSASFFDMIRENDESGVSGTGHVASGIIFQDGKVTVRWLGETASTVNFDSFDDFKAVHVDSHPGNKTKLLYHYMTLDGAKKMLKQVENKRILAGKVEEVDESFAARLERQYLDVLTDRLEFMPDTTPDLIAREIDSIVISMQQLAEKMAFGEVLLGYDEGKRTAGEDPLFAGLLKSIEKARAPDSIDFDNLPYSQPDVQALRSIYQQSPFWDSFESMSQAISDKLKQIIKESFEAPDSARFQSEFEQVQVEHPDRSVPEQQSIVFGRLGKFSLPQVIDQMKQVVNSEIYRLERIARTETHAVVLKGREIAFKERDPENEFRYDWIGPTDQRTTEICTEAKKRVTQAGGSVTLDQLDSILRSVTTELNPGWTYRSWTPHANCRHLFRKVS